MHTFIKKAFTLTELLVVIGILGILFAIVLIAINPSQQFYKVQETRTKTDLRNIRDALHNCISEHTTDQQFLGNCYTGIGPFNDTTTYTIAQGTYSGVTNSINLCPLVQNGYLSAIPINSLVPGTVPTSGTVDCNIITQYNSGFTVQGIATGDVSVLLVQTTLGNSSDLALYDSEGFKKQFDPIVAIVTRTPTPTPIYVSSNIPTSTPTPLPQYPYYKDIATADLHACGLNRSSEKVSCWGDNTYGKLGDGTTNSSSFPIAVNTSTTYIDVDSKGSHTCALKADGQIMCWGLNDAGQLGDNTFVNKSLPVNVQQSGLVFNKYTTGYDHTCGLRASDGKAYCWGSNINGRLGDNTTIDKKIPTAVQTGSLFQSISAHAFTTCGITNEPESRVMCWGRNTNGQLGDGTTTQRTVPTYTSDTSKYSYISAGATHTCGIIASTGKIYCWGKNLSGQLGTGNNTNSVNPTPAQVGSYTFKQLTSGYDHTCGLRTDNKVMCWGYNAFGQLGDNTLIDRNTPVNVYGNLNFKYISAGHDYTCGIQLEDDAIYCWGLNTSSQLSNGTSPTNAKIPTRVVN